MTDFLLNFHFLRPLWLLAILPAFFVLLLLFFQQRQRSQWSNLIDRKLLPYLLDGYIAKKSKTPLYGLFALWFFACAALAGPVWKKLPQPVEKSLASMMILWDLSPSMMAEDLKPSRLVRSRLKLMDLLNARKDGLTGLIAYSGDAHVVTPLTDDTRTIASQLAGLSPSIMPVSGSQPEAALELAIQSLKDAGIQHGDIVFLTDGIAKAAQAELRRLARTSGHRISVWGIGTEQGAPIPLEGGGFARGSNGEIVIAKTDDDQLSDAATEMGGLYIPFSNDELDIKTLLNFGLSQKKDNRDTEREFDQWQEEGPWLAFFLLPFAALAFRRGWVLSISLVSFIGLLGYTPPTQAFEWKDLWKTQDQQAYEALEKGDATKAAEQFTNPNWKAAAQYKAQNFDAAAENFAGEPSENPKASSLFNQANALTHAGKYDDAIAAYNAALKQQPDMQNAKDNKAIAEKLKALEEAAQQNQKSQNQNQQGQNQDQQNQQGQNGQQGEQGKQNQQQNGQGQDGQQQQGENQQGDKQQQNGGEQGEKGEKGQPQNSQQNSQGENGQDQPSKQQSAQSAADQNTQANQDEQNALDQHYGKQGDEKDDENKGEKNKNGEQGVAQQQADEQNKDKNAKQDQNTAMTEADKEGADEKDADAQQQQASMINPQDNKQREQKQQLRQWLNKVPDDPSGLLRNKFEYEHNLRKREFGNNAPRRPNTPENERW